MTSSTVVAATKTIAMTTLQKTIIGATLVAAVGTSLYQAHQAATLRRLVHILQQRPPQPPAPWFGGSQPFCPDAFA